MADTVKEKEAPAIAAVSGAYGMSWQTIILGVGAAVAIAAAGVWYYKYRYKHVPVPTAPAAHVLQQDLHSDAGGTQARTHTRGIAPAVVSFAPIVPIVPVASIDPILPLTKTATIGDTRDDATIAASCPYVPRLVIPSTEREERQGPRLHRTRRREHDSHRSDRHSRPTEKRVDPFLYPPPEDKIVRM
jgi:hypothetical protein